MLKVQEIREIIKLVDQSSINEFNYESNGTSVSLKKANGDSGEQVTNKTIDRIEQQPEISKEETVKVTEEKQPDKVADPQQESNVDYDYEIVSPMVGTLYIAPTPESDAYVSKGSKVENDTVVCIVEAMKLFNEIEAEVSGEIVEIMAEDGELVEYGQSLFRVKKH
ncbi:acetyl-CoA carboxylase biotin carboxyl carrier protein [Virgibacillus natechei]|uniref:Biotin carboxyl carrier protein of acetyl-CoA carboxylase n=1 Tax=Virgibacillus natechei TaxID=1216297 RepID=A0ABS4IFI4_9BACI|nr:acetyl-CoA carboxylase biotin carboxyl carrier protein [Virgibacillus natechei]MBP1969712.1 acetyl-CoA carboxylase biotin carboxyl carrier protein [Virgibacillus natechei]UZD11437.1 acetyl-CoA carboxylase biotin carboxyl carrier protein [Virgibacillus natechei]